MPEFTPAALIFRAGDATRREFCWSYEIAIATAPWSGSAHFDAYQYRISSKKPQPGSTAGKKKPKELKVPPKANEKPWWDKFWTVPIKARDRKIFA